MIIKRQEMKVCKVVSTFFSDSRIDRSYEREGYEPVRWSTHIQFGVPGEPGIKKMIEDTISLDKDVDTGADCDILLINNVNGSVEFDEYIRSLNNTETKNGKIFTFEKENEGGQFGAFDFIWHKFEDEYDFWIFTEDDIIITGHEYYSKLIERLGKDTAYALCGVVKHEHHPPHACSACMLIPKKILKVIRHIPFPLVNDIPTRIARGEIAFSTKILDAGFKLTYDGPGKYMVTKEWPFEFDYCLPYRQLIEENGSVDEFKKLKFFKGE